MRWLRNEKLQVAMLLTVAFAAHAFWLARYGQLQLGGDQAAYREAGRSILDALQTGTSDGGQSIRTAREWLDFAGVGLFYGIVDALWPENLEALYWVLTALHGVCILGAYCLARAIGGRLAAVLAGLWCVLSPAFPAHAARLYPDPLTATFFVWGLILYCSARRWRGFVTAGVVLGLALVVRVQLLPWLIAIAALSILASVPMWARSSELRRRVLGTSIGLAIVGLGWWGVMAWSLPPRDSRAPKHNLPRYHYYAYGVWQYAETDGWEGPYRLRTEPFYKALQAAADQDSALLKSRPRQYVFALGYMWGRRSEFALLVLDNFYRMWDRPVNPEHRPFPLPLPAQRVMHRAAVLAALLGIGAALSRGRWLYPVPLLWLVVAALHAFAYPALRYTAPVLPIVFALAGAGAATAWARRSGSRGSRRWPATLVAASAAAAAVAWSIADVQPEFSRLLFASATVAFLVAPFAWMHSTWQHAVARWTVASAGILAASAVAAHAARMSSWHERTLALSAGAAVRQSILVPDAAGSFAAAGERYLTIDLETPEGKASDLRLVLNGSDVSARLVPSMPQLREAIPDEEEALTYPQWWVAPLSREEIAEIVRRGRADVELEVLSGAPILVKADRFAEQQRVYEGPSWGEWPNAVGLKPEYDRDYRLTVRRPLASTTTTSSVRRLGEWASLSSVLRIRVVTLGDTVGTVTWKTAPPPAANSRATGAVIVFSARSGIRKRGFAELSVNGSVVGEFPVGNHGDYVIEGPSGRLCYLNRTRLARDEWEAAGIYAVACESPRPAELQVIFRPGMSDRPMMFGLESRQPTLDQARAAAAKCGFTGDVLVGISDLRTRGNTYPDDLGRWSIAAVY